MLFSNAFKSDQNLKNEIGILKSFSLNYKVMQKLSDFHIVYVGIGKRGIVESSLYKNIPFKVVPDSIQKQNTSLRVSIKILSSDSCRLEINSNTSFNRTLAFGERFNGLGFDFTVVYNSGIYPFDPEASNRYYFYFVNPASLANQYRGKLNVFPIEEDATLVTLMVNGPIPQQDADYLNTLMDVYLDQGLEVKNKTAEKTIDFVDDQIGSISDSLSIVENDLEIFRLSNHLIDISQEGAIIQNKLERFEYERSLLIIQRKYYDYLQEYINSKNETGDIISPGAMGVDNSELNAQVLQLTSNITNDSDILVLTATFVSSSGTANVLGTLSWQELY